MEISRQTKWSKTNNKYAKYAIQGTNVNVKMTNTSLNYV